jgi:hypothetical protein
MLYCSLYKDNIIPAYFKEKVIGIFTYIIENLLSN